MFFFGLKVLEDLLPLQREKIKDIRRLSTISSYYSKNENDFSNIIKFILDIYYMLISNYLSLFQNLK